jgi:hypothetical protein
MPEVRPSFGYLLFFLQLSCTPKALMDLLVRSLSFIRSLSSSTLLVQSLAPPRIHQVAGRWASSGRRLRSLAAKWCRRIKYTSTPMTRRVCHHSAPILAALVSAAGLGLAALPASVPPAESAIEAKPTMSDLALESDAKLPAARELMTLLAATCGAGNVQPGKPGEQPSCTAVTGYPTSCDDLRIAAAVPGHYTSATADEMLADYDAGCESHATNFGGSVLLRRSAGSWRRLSFTPGLRSDRCLRFARSDGRDALVCFGHWQGQGFEEATVDLLTFGSDGLPSSARLLDLHGILRSFLVCQADQRGKAHRLSILTGWRRIAGAVPGLELRLREESFTTPDFCTNQNDDEAVAKGIFARLQAFRDAHAHSATVRFEWRDDTMARRETLQRRPFTRRAQELYGKRRPAMATRSLRYTNQETRPSGRRSLPPCCRTMTFMNRFSAPLTGG